MRIIAGKHKGRRIELGKEADTIRPTSDFAREAIFNILAHGNHAVHFPDMRVLDLFCGTGAFGLEALSRGAAYAMFVDQSREAVTAARTNAEHLHETETVDFLLADVTRLPRARQPFSLIFLDPPYFSKLLAPSLKSLAAGGWMAPGALIVAEHDAKETLDVPPDFTLLDERRYGRAMVKMLQAAPKTD